MTQADFSYDCASEQEFPVSGVPLAVSIFAARPDVQEELREDVAVAGLALREIGPLSALLDDDQDAPRAFGEIILLDCPDELSGRDLVALARMDDRAARSGAQLVISTSMHVLEEVFACCDQSDPKILVNPGRADRVIALGTVMANFSNRRLRELSEDDRRTLLRLTEQVGQIADQLGRFAPDLADPQQSAAVSDHARAFNFNAPVESGSPALPDPRLVRRIIQQRQLRGRFFDSDLFADPAWDMLLDLTAAQVEHTRISVTSLCIASGVPPTTALRWIGQMTQAGLLKRVEDETDRRRAFIALTDSAVVSMARYFAEVEQGAMQLA